MAGVDDASFTIVGDELFGAVVFDYESPVDSDTNNDYEICVRVTDDAGNAYDEAMTISITNQVEIASVSSHTVNETESTQNVVVTVTLDTPAAVGGQSIAYTTVDATGLAGTHYTAQAGAVLIPAGTTS